MTARGGLGYRLIAAATVAAARRRASGRGCYGPAGPVVTAFLTTVLATAELDELTVRLYEAAPVSYAPERGLFDWERDWYEAALPPAPARILVTAAGAGREVAALLARGYVVDAFEPVPRLACACAALPRFGTVVVAAHDDFVRAACGDGRGPAAPLGARAYDAVVVGWGSLGHLLTPSDREALLRACRAVSPRGPILASFYTARAEPPPGPGSRAARAAGGGLRRLRRLPPPPGGVTLLWHAGFRRCCSRDDIEALAAALDERVAVAMEPYGHATFGRPD